jgi:membrane-bound lytic murein transglycosylase A
MESEIPEFSDDLDPESLRRAVGQSLKYLDRLPPERAFQYGPRKVSPQEVRETLLSLLRILDETPSPSLLSQRLRREFLWFQAAGRDLFRAVLFTGYYLPLLEGRRRADETFRFPLYSMPSDLVEADLGRFRESLRGQRIAGRTEGRKLVPYHTRAEIDGDRKLEGKGLEIAWLRDPIDRFFLHIQGSGLVTLGDGERLNVNFAGANGHPYRSIGRILMEEGAISREEMSMQAIRAYLLAHPERMDELFHANPSYVFFRVLKDGPLGNLEVPITPGRTIATDTRLFPRGGLAFVSSQRPVTDSQGTIQRWERFSRLVLNQDTGGAIQGAGRVDLYCGAGLEAEVMAGHLQHEGKLFFLIRKP